MVDVETGINEPLVNALRAWRQEESRTLNTPAYWILSQRTLVRIAAEEPQTLDALQAIHGVGETKARRYGEIILAIVRQNPGVGRNLPPLGDEDARNIFPKGILVQVLITSTRPDGERIVRVLVARDGIVSDCTEYAGILLSGQGFVLLDDGGLMVCTMGVIASASVGRALGLRLYGDANALPYRHV